MPSNFTVKTRVFEGPLELLLNLIEERKLHINDISLAEITDDYLAYIRGQETFPLGATAHFILIAATLVLLKSRSLLPSLSLTEEEEGDIQDLEQRLRAYKRIKELSAHVAEMWGSRVIFAREYSRQIVPVFSPTGEMTPAGLADAIRRVLGSLPKKEMIPQAIVKKVLSLDETIRNLTTRIQEGLEMSFREYAGDAKERGGIIVNFLAVLELVRRGIIVAVQETHFGDIALSKKAEAGEGQDSPGVR